MSLTSVVSLLIERADEAREKRGNCQPGSGGLEVGVAEAGVPGKWGRTVGSQTGFSFRFDRYRVRTETAPRGGELFRS
jgi:hypothetical protein